MVYSNYVSNVIKSGLTGYTTATNIIYEEVYELTLAKFLLMKFLTFILCSIKEVFFILGRAFV